MKNRVAISFLLSIAVCSFAMEEVEEKKISIEMRTSQEIKQESENNSTQTKDDSFHNKKRTLKGKFFYYSCKSFFELYPYANAVTLLFIADKIDPKSTTAKHRPYALQADIMRWSGVGSGALKIFYDLYRVLWDM